MPGKVVFISYSHDSDEHREKVLGLAERLRQDGLDAQLDQYVNGTPEQGWPRWMLDQFDEASYVLVVCTETYYRRFRGHEVPGRGKGATWEGALITQEIYDAGRRTVKFVPVLLSAGNEQFIPEPLGGHTYYELTSEEQYQALYAFLLGQAGVQPGPLGDLKPASKRTAQPLTFAPAPEPPLAAAKAEEATGRREKQPARSLLMLLLMLLAVVLLVIGPTVPIPAPSITSRLEPQDEAIVEADNQEPVAPGAAGKPASPAAAPAPVADAPQTKPSVPALATCTPGEKYLVNDFIVVPICAGTFPLGWAENASSAENNEKPVRQVTLGEFLLDETEMTNGHYRRFRPNHQGEPHLPATNVNWDDANAACHAFGGRLPTEAEWEYAARAGSRTVWPFGDNEMLLDDYEWYAENSGGKPQTVRARKPNEWGLHDMLGNVHEWVADWYSPEPNFAKSDPGPSAGEYRVLRGGSYSSSPEFLRPTLRFRGVPDFRGSNLGFRCARDFNLLH